MHITQDAKTFKVSARDNIYIIDRITFNIDEVTLIASVLTINENKLI